MYHTHGICDAFIMFLLQSEIQCWGLYSKLGLESFDLLTMF